MHNKERNLLFAYKVTEWSNLLFAYKVTEWSIKLTFTQFYLKYVAFIISLLYSNLLTLKSVNYKLFLKKIKEPAEIYQIGNRSIVTEWLVTEW